MKYVVLVGAARSGTKIMRDSSSAALGFDSVPYDIPYIWRMGTDAQDDELPVKALTQKNARRIRAFIDRYDTGSGVVVEKTVGNTLRVPYVAEALPGATFVHLIRDGVDVTESAARQWQEKSDWRYVARKARHFPLRLVPSYGVKYVRDSLLRGRQSTPPMWGPIYEGMAEDTAQLPLEVVCARQWARCVKATFDGLAQAGVTPVEVRYEDLVADPGSVLRRVAQAVDVPVDEARLTQGAARVTAGGKGRGRAHLRPEVREAVAAEIDPTLVPLGYEPLRGL